MVELEQVLAHVSLFAHLRPDEIARVSKRFHVDALAAGESRAFAEARMVVVVRGAALLEVDAAGGVLRSPLEEGDRYGALSLVTGYSRRFVVRAPREVTIATIDREAFEAVMKELPAIALPVASEVAEELSARNDLLRQLLELHAERLPPEELEAAIRERRDVLRQRGAHVSRLSPRALFEKLVVAEGAEPPFWMLVGFAASLGAARLVVHLILKYKLEKQLFALVPGTDPNPMHVHHFNYGLILLGSAGIAALFPLGRRALRFLALAFGFGCGLVFDEFALLWNLDPEYAQGLSLWAAAIACVVLVQLAYFRSFWTALARRAWLRARGAR
jgi:CRP-like cAMP-binding protein